jgi:hypothetical protein
MKVGTTDIQARARAVKDRVPMSSIVGIDLKLTKKGSEQEACCPFHGERTGSFMINDAKQFAQCFGCGWNGDVIKYLIERKSMTFIAALRLLEADAGISFDTPANRAEVEQRRIERQRSEEEAAKQKQESARSMWLYAAPLAGTPAQAYLEGRGIDFTILNPLPGALRYRHDCVHAEMKQKIPAMLAAIIRLGKHVATHRTYLEYRNGKWEKLDKIWPEQSRRVQRPEEYEGRTLQPHLMGYAFPRPPVKYTAKSILGSFKGGSIPLWRGDQTKSLENITKGKAVHVSEGIEDGLTIAMIDTTQVVRAAATLDKIGTLILPPQAGDLYIIGQHDKRRPDLPRDAVMALEAAIAQQQDQAEAHATESGELRRIMMRWPPPEYKDFNDVLRGVKMERAA